jgi:hypothetical protein
VIDFSSSTVVLQVVGDPTCFGAIINCVRGLNKTANAVLSENMKPRKNVLYSIRKNGIIDIHDNFISVYSRTQIHRHGSPDEIFVNYGDDYWKINMDLCGRCFQSESIRQNPILYCDLKNCNQSFHLLCLQNQDSSQLRQSPWFCPACVKMNEEVTVDVGLIITSEERKQSLYFARPSRAASAVTQRRHHPSKRKIDEQETVHKMKTLST